MHLIVPYLFPSTEFLDIAAQDLRLPALETLIARGKVSVQPPQGIEGALCRAWGIEKQADWPWAPMSGSADGIDADNAYWLRADPVHVRIQRDKLILLGGEHLDISSAEADTLLNDLRSHFGEAFYPQSPHPCRWYLRLNDNPDIETTLLSLALGQHIDPLLPRGPNAMTWRALLNEIQMLLFDHPVNREREARGLPAINSVWIWGGGRRVQPGSVPGQFHALDEHLLSIAERFVEQGNAWSGKPDDIDAGGVALLVPLASAGQFGDVVGWREAAKELDMEWLSRLAKRGVKLKLEDPVSGTLLDFSPSDRWKFWQRGKPLVKRTQGAASRPSTPPVPGCDVDEFGNAIGRMPLGQ